MHKKFTVLYGISALLLFSLALDAQAGGAQNKDATVTAIECPGDPGDGINEGLDCYRVEGWSQGNHELNCTVIVPESASATNPVPLIAWANGWEQGVPLQHQDADQAAAEHQEGAGAGQG